MADDVTVNADAEYVVATDDDGSGNHVQIVKLALSADGSRVPITADSGGLLVNLGSNNDVTVTSGTVDLGATDNAVLDAIAASLAAIDTDATTIIGHVDGLEALIGTTNTTLTTIDGRVDGIEGLLTTIDSDTSNLSVVGGGTEAAAIRVTIANNSTGVLSVDDNGSTISIDDGAGSITVDGTVAVTGVSTLAEQQTQTTHLATIAGDTTAIETAVQLIDNAVYTDDADFTDGTSVGFGVMGVAENTPSTVTDGDMGMLAIVPATRALKTNDASAIALLGTIDADTSNLSVVGGGTEAAAIRVTIANNSTGVLSIDDNGGNISIDDGGNIITVDGTVAVSSITTAVVPGTAATNLGKAEDAGHTTGDVGVMMLAVRNDDANTVLTSQDLDYSPLAVAQDGSLWVDMVRPVPLAAAQPGATSNTFETFKSIDLDESEEEVVDEPIALHGYFVSNSHASAFRYVKFYDDVAANVIVGTTVPLYEIAIPPSASAHLSLVYPWMFNTSATVAATTGPGDTDTGAPGAGEVFVQLWYET